MTEPRDAAAAPAAPAAPATPDFVLMQLVHADEYARLDEREDGFVPVKPARDCGGTGSPRGRASSPHYSSPLPGKGEPTGGLEAPLSPGRAPEPVAAEAQMMILQNLLRSEAASSASSAATDSVDSWLQTSQNSDPNGPFSMWPPALLDQALRLGLLDPRTAPRLIVPEGSSSVAPSGPWEPLKDQDSVVLALARRLGQMGEERDAGNCSCHSSAPGRKPDEELNTSDALLVLEGLQGPQGPQGTELRKGLNRSLDRISDHRAEQVSEQGSRSQPQSRAPTPKLCVASGGRSLSPLVVLETDKLSSFRSRGKSRKGSLKLRLSKLFRTRSSGAGPGLTDKRPSLASSTSSGGSLLDVWGSGSSTQDQDPTRLQMSRPLSAFSPVPFTPAFTGETVSMVDLDISRRSALHPPTPPPPPRRSLSLLDDYAGPPPHLDGGMGVSMQSLPPRSLMLPPAVGAMHHSLSLNDAFLRGLPRPIPLRPDTRPPPRPAPRCPLSQSDGGSFATSLRELEKCGWYWGPMNWEDAEAKLKEKPDGSFLVRDSSDPRYILSLSFRSQNVTHHTRMEHYRGTFSLWCQPKFEDRCHSVVEFIDRAIAHSKNGKFLYFLRSRVPGSPPTPVQLLYPVSRFSSVKTLQHLCRFCIRQTVRIDHIQNLPLPTPLILYLRRFYFYDPEEEVQLKQT
ncbi:suppressor of cytokine signaling 7-like [Eucyclogobius newberryi]|uniref:suppressor of cytokine signaling 7-like n=1 Tax=Eucyclogobius newberryi TaxID=166745 RepID=UPI003B5AE0C2